MDNIQYKNVIKGIGARKSLGQNFLVNQDIAILEANYATKMNVIELGPGLGILTRELCKVAKKVVAIEKDKRLFDILVESIEDKNVVLINEDFFSANLKDVGKIDIMVSNIPYSLSSKVVYWLSKNDIPALICIQKEFAEHMLSSPGTRTYSKLSVITSLKFKAHLVKDIGAGNFYPIPKVGSCLIYLAPKSIIIDDRTIQTISAIMNHKKKRLKNAIVDSAKAFGITKDQAKKLSNEFKESEMRPFHLDPETIMGIAEHLNKIIHQNE
jgi:16S rRNA (adenine1518-N6/adenine1519-N6)-dimethyltransferase